MKRTGFKRKPPTGFKPRKPLKRSKLPQVKRKAKKRVKLPAIKTLRNKCDKLLTPIVKLMHPHCLLQGSTSCAYETQVAHHHVHKSSSNRLRYDLDNLIPLCHSCHLMLHQNESYWASKIVAIKGLSWFNTLEAKKNELVKTDVHWFTESYQQLRALYDEISMK